MGEHNERREEGGTLPLRSRCHGLSHEPDAWCAWLYWIITKTPWYRINLFLLMKKVRLRGSEWLPQVCGALRGEEAGLEPNSFLTSAWVFFHGVQQAPLMETAGKCPDNQKSEESGEIYMGFPGRHEGPWAQAPASGTSRNPLCYICKRPQLPQLHCEAPPFLTVRFVFEDKDDVCFVTAVLPVFGKATYIIEDK